MPTDCISFQNSGYFTPLVVDYLDQKQELQKLYNRFPVVENFEKQIAAKQLQFAASTRKILVTALERQYNSIAISDVTRRNIGSLLEQNTFTITTGHQLNLFTGPLYFLYKIISTINLTRELKAKYPHQNFVPVFCMES